MTFQLLGAENWLALQPLERSYLFMALRLSLPGAAELHRDHSCSSCCSHECLISSKNLAYEESEAVLQGAIM